MECCNLLVPPSPQGISEDIFVPPHASDDFREALRYHLEVNQAPGGEPNKWLPESLGLLRRLCFILGQEGKLPELFG